MQSSSNSSSSGESGESENNNGEGSTQTPEVNVDSSGIITATVQEDGWYTIGIAGGNGGNGASARLGSGIGGSGTSGSYVKIRLFLKAGNILEFNVGVNGNDGNYGERFYFGNYCEGGSGGTYGYIKVNDEYVLISSAGSGGNGAFSDNDGASPSNKRLNGSLDYVDSINASIAAKYNGNSGKTVNVLNANSEAVADLSSSGCSLEFYNGNKVDVVFCGLKTSEVLDDNWYLSGPENVYSCTVTWSDLTYLADSAQWDTSSHVYTATNNTSAGFAASANGGTITATNTGNMPVYATFSATPSLSNLQTVNIAFSNNNDDVIEVDGTKSTSVIVSGTVTFDSATTPTTVGTCKVTISKNAPTQKEAA